MARQGEALIKRILTPLNSGVELFFAESRLAFCATDDTTNIEEQQLITLLVSFTPPDTARWSARAFAATLVAAKAPSNALLTRSSWLTNYPNYLTTALLDHFAWCLHFQTIQSFYRTKSRGF